MFTDDTRKKLENIVRGVVIEGQEIIARQPVTTYAQALAQVKRLKETSKVSSSIKKGRPNA